MRGRVESGVACVMATPSWLSSLSSLRSKCLPVCVCQFDFSFSLIFYRVFSYSFCCTVYLSACMCISVSLSYLVSFFSVVSLLCTLHLSASMCLSVGLYFFSLNSAFSHSGFLCYVSGCTYVSVSQPVFLFFCLLFRLFLTFVILSFVFSIPFSSASVPFLIYTFPSMTCQTLSLFPFLFFYLSSFLPLRLAIYTLIHFLNFSLF